MCREENQSVSPKRAKRSTKVCYQYGLARRIVANRSLGSLHCVVALCAEPAMGSARFLDEIKAGYAAARHKVHYRSLVRHCPEPATRIIVRAANELALREEISEDIVIFEDIPSSDEEQSIRQARAIRKLASRCALVVISVLPEAAHLLELIEDVLVLSSCDLAADVVSSLESEPEADALIKSTRGIAPLVDSLKTYGWGGKGFGYPPTYCKTCTQICGGMLREGLTAEELSLRLYLLLVGKGLLKDAATALGIYAEDYARDLASFVPALGVDSEGERFDALGSDDLDVLRACVEPAAALGSLLHEVATKALKTLVERGEYARAAVVAQYSDACTGHDLVLLHAPYFLNCGEWHLVREALADSDASCRHGIEYLKLVKRAMMSLTRPSSRPAANASRHDDWSAPTNEVGLKLLIELRNAQARVPNSGELPKSLSGGLEKALVFHLALRELMHRGCFDEALELLVGSCKGEAVGGVAGLSLLMDECVCRVALGDVEAAMVCLAKVEAESAALGCRGLVSELVVLRGVISALIGANGSGDAMAAIAAVCEKSGNAVGRVVALTVAVAKDLGTGSGAQALIRSRLLATSAAALGEGYVYDLSRVLSEIAIVRTGGTFSFGTEPWPSEETEAIARIVEEGITGVAKAMVPASVPPNVSWFAVLLARDLGDVSSLIREQMPREWRLKTSLLEEAWESAVLPMGKAGDGTVTAGMAGNSSQVEKARGVEVSLLGGFSMTVNGQQVPEGALDRRDAKAVLQFLLLRERMSARRFEVIEQVWPDEPMPKGKARLYQATTVIRAAVRQIDPDLEIFSISKATKTISLNAELVHCDVEEFESVAFTAVERLDPARTIRAARRADELYGGDLFSPPVDATGFVASKRDVLKGLYVDAMVAGAEVALQTGRDGLAVKCARSAVTTDGMREDAFAAYIKALKACGRTTEAAREYERYARQIVRAKRVPPSRMLREIAADGLGFSSRERAERRAIVEQMREEGLTAREILAEGEMAQG